MWHCADWLLPLWDVVCPSGQFVQELASFESLYVPLGQIRHSPVFEFSKYPGTHTEFEVKYSEYGIICFFNYFSSVFTPVWKGKCKQVVCHICEEHTYL